MQESLYDSEMTNLSKFFLDFIDEKIKNRGWLTEDERKYE